MESKKYQRAKLAQFTTNEDAEKRQQAKMAEISKIYKEDHLKFEKTQEKASEEVEWCAYLGMYIIMNIKDSNIRETFGFYSAPNLYLWPEEAQLLWDKGLLKASLKIPVATDLAGFYSVMRRDGYFLTRDSRFMELKAKIQDYHSLIETDPESQLKIKRQKLDYTNGGDQDHEYIIYQVYGDRQEYNKKQNIKQRIMLWRKEQVNLETIGAQGQIKVAFAKNSQVVILDFNSNIACNLPQSQLPLTQHI